MIFYNHWMVITGSFMKAMGSFEKLFSISIKKPVEFKFFSISIVKVPYTEAM